MNDVLSLLTQGTDLTSYDLIAIYLPKELNSNTVAVGRYVLIDSNKGSPA